MKMKRTCIAFFCFIFLLLQAVHLSDSIAEELPALPLENPEAPITLDFQDVSLKDILKAFSIQAGVNFIPAQTVQDKKISLFLDNVPIKEAIDKFFTANNLSYEVDGKSNVVIVKESTEPIRKTITKVYYLKYRSVTNSTFEKEKNKLFGHDGSSGADIIESIKQVMTGEGKLTEDRLTNSIIVTDVPTVFQKVDEIMARLDIPEPQVMLEVEILDVSTDTVDKLGVEFGQSPLTLNLLFQGASVPSKFPFGSIFGDINKGITNGKFAVNSGASNNAASTYQIILNYLTSKSDTRYLARPRVLTMNNETAEISITKDEIIGYKEAVDTVTTGSVSRTDYIRASSLSLTSEGVGVYLRITPQINMNTKEVTLVLNPKSSATALSTLATSQSDPEVRMTKSVIKINDGETVVIGGLIFKDKSMTEKKLPVLGDIPLFGALFRNKNQTKDKDRELLIFITPHLVFDSVLMAQGKNLNIADKDHRMSAIVSRQEIINAYLNNMEKQRIK
jgi:type II secretory pathway component GspD/PulD (secretin)